VLAQDERWFDNGGVAGVSFVQILAKDGDGARNLVAIVIEQGCVVMAIVRQLALAGVRAPSFGGVMASQAARVAKSEMRNKRTWQGVAKGCHDTIVNICSICVIGYEEVFEHVVDRALLQACGACF